MTQTAHAVMAALPARGGKAVAPRAPARPSVVLRAGVMPWVPVWLALGIGGWFLLPVEPGRGFYAGLLVAAVLCLIGLRLTLQLAGAGRIGWFWVDRGRIAALFLLLTMAGAGIAALRTHMVAAPVLGFRYYGPVEGRVIGIDRSARDRMRLLLDRVRLSDVAPGRTPARVRISLLQQDRLPVPGQRIMLTAHLGPPSGPSEPGGFDFRRLAWFERIGAIGYTRTPIMSVGPPERHGTLALHRVRMTLAQAMRDRIGGQAGAVAAALMTGDRSGISEATNDAMRASNLYHIISISGLHMSMLAGFVYAGLRMLVSLMQVGAGAHVLPAHKLSAMGALAASALYLWLSGGGVATERAFVTVAVMLLAIIADRRAVSLRTVALAATIVLLLGPEALTEPGFQLSFAATTGLILANEPWQKHAGSLPRWLRPVAMLVLSSVVAGLVTAPIAAAHFGRVTQYGLLANMLVVPVVGAVVMPGGVLAALLAPLGLAQPALWAMGLGVQWMLAVAEWVASLGGAVIVIPAPPRMVLPLLGIGAVLTVLAPVLASHGGSSRALPRRIVGICLLASAGGLWAAASRPDILISADGNAVAVMTDAGRVPSRQSGGAFAIGNWLAADGDAADQIAAAGRPLWAGEPTNRWVDIKTSAGEWRIRHLTGKRARERVAEYCVKGSVLVTNADMGGALSKGCRVIDARYLRARGAISAMIGKDGMSVETANRHPTGRIWQ